MKIYVKLFYIYTEYILLLFIAYRKYVLSLKLYRVGLRVHKNVLYILSAVGGGIWNI